MIVVFLFLSCIFCATSKIRHGADFRIRHTPRNIFIDLGTNDGSSLLAFAEKTTANHSFNQDGSNLINGGWQALLKNDQAKQNESYLWDIVAVEANNEYTEKVIKIKEKLLEKKNIRSITFYNGTAVADYDGSIQFIDDGLKGASQGATIMSESKSAIGNKRSIPAIDIVTLFRQEHIRRHDFVVVKMDVEGAEYDILRRVIVSGLWRDIDRLAIEWHHKAFFVFGKPWNQTDPNYEKDLAIHMKYSIHYESLMWMLQATEKDNGPVLFNWG